jgi:hypothetical protein
VRTLWPALRDSLFSVRSFDAVMSDVRRNRNLLHAAALSTRQVTDQHEDYRDGPPRQPWPQHWKLAAGVVMWIVALITYMVAVVMIQGFERP